MPCCKTLKLIQLLQRDEVEFHWERDCRSNFPKTLSFVPKKEKCLAENDQGSPLWHVLELLDQREVDEEVDGAVEGQTEMAHSKEDADDENLCNGLQS